MNIYLLFFFSGISGLIYEIIWLRMLSRVLGCTVYATSIVLISFMAGLAIGSYIIGRNCGKIKNKLRFYAILEMGIGLSAMILTFSFNWLVPFYKIIYSISGGERFGLTVFQSVLMFLLLLIPTSLMGGTLPILSAYTRTHGTSFARRSACLYGLNTLGALIGVLASGMYLVGALGETNTLFIGVLINILVSLMAVSLSKINAENRLDDPGDQKVDISPYGDSARRSVLMAYAFSGFTAMAYEVIWTRIFQVQIGTSVYAFSMILAFYLAGVGSGSLWGAKYVDNAKDPLKLLAFLQLLIAAYAIAGMYAFTIFEPAVDVIDWKNMIFMPLLIVFPITFVLGLIFPAVSRSFVKNEKTAGREIGLLYSVNTLGCIMGSLVCGFIFIKIFGTRGTLLALAIINALIALTIFYRISPAPFARNYKMNTAVSGLVAICLIGGVWSPDPFLTGVIKVMKKGRHAYSDKMKIFFHKEDVSATISVCGPEGDPLRKILAINGVGMTHLCVETKLMAHIPILLCRDPKDMLIVCFGMGTALRSAWTHKALRCDVVELVPAEYDYFNYFHSNGSSILSDPRIRHYADDGRNFLLMRYKKYDVITMDPSPPIYSAGTVNLYTKEFFELCKERLNPQGVMCAWIPPAQYSEVRMIMKTFYSVFPNTYVFGGPYYYGLFMVGFKDMAPPKADRFTLAGNDPDIVADLKEWNPTLNYPEAIPGLLVLKPDQLALFVQNNKVPIVTDDHPYTEFPLWRSIFSETYAWQLNAAVLSKIRDEILVPYEEAASRSVEKY